MFSVNSKGAPQAAGKSRSGFSFIGPDVVVTGNITTSGQLHIDGKVEGDVRCASLIQGESGAISGNIEAEEATLAGLVDGGVSAGNLMAEASVRITGDVLYETLTVASGAQVDGRFRRRSKTPEGVAAPGKSRSGPLDVEGAGPEGPSALFRSRESADA